MFIPQQTIYNLHFEDAALSELEMKVSACSVEEFNNIMAGASLVGEEAIKATEDLLTMFARHIVKWNIGKEVDGKQEILPITPETLKSLDQPLVIRLLSAWQTAMVTVPNPSKPGFSSGEISEELSLGLANGSVSQPSWPQ